jgi:hypothetical protein
MSLVLPPAKAKFNRGLILLPGAPQVELGQKMKGVLLFTGTLLFSLFPVSLFATIPFCMMDSLVLLNRRNRGQKIGDWEWFWSTKGKPVWRITETRKMGRAEQPVGTDTKVLDNSRSDSRIIRNLKVAREWSYEYNLESEELDRKINTSAIRFRDGGESSKTIERSLRKSFGYTQGTKQVYEENVQVEIQARKKVTILFHWKRIVETGVLTLEDQFQNTSELPFSVVIGLTFDQEHIDDNSP